MIASGGGCRDGVPVVMAFERWLVFAMAFERWLLAYVAVVCCSGFFRRAMALERWLQSDGSVAVVAMALAMALFERWLWALLWLQAVALFGVGAMALCDGSVAMALPSDGFSSVGSSYGSL